MNLSLKSFLLTILIIMIIGMLIFFNYYYFLQSPTMLYDQKDVEVLETFEKANELSNLNLESRYVFDKIYYSASDQDLIYFFLDDGSLVLTLAKDELDFDLANQVADELFPEFDNNIFLSVYNDQPVYVIVNAKYDVFIDYKNYDEVFRVRKGIGDD